jgi:radical SAM superfamily enzyme YgiQ (UPF0313 family)
MPWVALVGPELEENLSLRYLASSLAAAGFPTEIFPFDGEEQFHGVLDGILGRTEPPLLVGLSLSFQRRAKDFLALAVALRRAKYAGHITAGGHFGTFACLDILSDFREIDSICRHEAEETLVRLALAVSASGDLARILHLDKSHGVEILDQPSVQAKALCTKQNSGCLRARTPSGRGSPQGRDGAPSGFARGAGREWPSPFRKKVLLHQGEHGLQSLQPSQLQHPRLEEIPGLAYREAGGEVRLTGLPRPPDLGRLPWPDRRGQPSQCLGHRVAPLVGSRGCYANCAFCCISAWHEQTLPGQRFRLRPVEDVAEEMAWLNREKGIEVFIFHDDNFFLPRRDQSLDRIHALGDALGQLGVKDNATIVKARPNDLDREILDAMISRLGLIRIFLGVESDSAMGLRTLGRRVDSAQNHRALELLEEAGIYACFNMLIFDPDTRVEDLATNLSFMERYAEVPMNFGRVELYAGTPLLERMLAEGRATGDYLEWDYRMASEDVQRIFELAMACFYIRNFSDESAPHRLMGTRFCVEVAARYHPEAFEESWRDESKKLNRLLVEDSVAAMRKIIRHATSRDSRRQDAEFARELSNKLRVFERRIHDAAGLLETEVQDAVMTTGRGPRIKGGENENARKAEQVVRARV